MDIPSIIIKLFVLLFAFTIHEAAHAWTALKLGDPTAHSRGRVSLNPLVHIDLFGTIILPGLCILSQTWILIGWAKPTPINTDNLRNPRRDNLWVSLAGPASNLGVAFAGLVLILVLRALFPQVTGFLREFLVAGLRLPSGIHLLEGLSVVLFYLVWINSYLAVFNLIPVPPLDGSHILSGLLSERAGAAYYSSIRPYGLLIVVALFYLGLLDVVFLPMNWFIKAFVFF